VQQADGLVVGGAFAVQGLLSVGGLFAQRGDGVAGGVQPGGDGGERAGVLAGVVVTGAGGVAADGIGGGERVVAVTAGATGFLPCGGQRGLGVFSCPGLLVQPGDRFGGRGTGLGGVQFGGVPGGCLPGGLGAGLLDLGGGRSADSLGLRLGGLRVGGGGQLLADGSQGVQRGSQLPGQPGHRSQRVVADRRGPADRRRHRTVRWRLPGELLPAPERGHRGMPDRHHRAIPAVLGNLLLAVPGPGARRRRVLDPGQIHASRIPASARQRRRRGRLGNDRRHCCCPFPRVPAHAHAKRDETKRNEMR